MREDSSFTVKRRIPRTHNPYGHLGNIPNRLYELIVAGRQDRVEFVDKVSSYGCWCQLRQDPNSWAVPTGLA